MVNHDIIKDILSNSSHLRESYILNNYPYLHEDVIQYIILNNLPNDITFKEKFWYYIHNIITEKICLVCDGKVRFNKKFTDGYKNFCSAKCTQQNPETKLKRKKTTIEKYGVDNIAKLDESKKKAEETNIERYGCKSSFQNEEVKNKWKDTIKEKYGVEHVFQSSEVKDKSIETNLKKYGTKHFVQSEEYLTKLITNNLEKYGVRFYQHTDEYRHKTIKTNQEKYGCDYFIESEEFNTKTKKTLDELGVEFTSQLPSVRSKNIEHNNNKRIDKYKKLGFTIDKYDGTDFIDLHDIDNCQHQFTINKQLLRKRISNKEVVCTICNSVNISASNMELELKDFINNLYKGDIIYNSRSVIENLELDIYLPNLNLAFEFNGLYWHSEEYKDKKYHKIKTELCENIGIDLINIWEDDWLYKDNIIKSIISNRLGVLSDRIYARKCVIKEVSAKTSREFLDNNHIQGYSNSKVKIGLYYNDELVSLMTFGDRYINGEKETELIRFCNILNTSVVGSASKLFKYYIKNYDFESIKSYADVSMFNGNLYKELGFEFIHRSSPNYFWIIKGLRKHRFNYNKKKLIKEGFNPLETEVEIMHGRGYYRIWGSGQDLYIFKK